MLGTISFVIEMLLAKRSITLFMLTTPAVMVATILLSFIFRNKIYYIPNNRKVLGSILITVGMIVFIMNAV